jgi:hypothetical protein
MICNTRGLVTLVIFLGIFASVQADDVNDVSVALNKFFSLFEYDCPTWVKVFEKGATFAHPKFLDGITGTQALIDFCGKAQAVTQVQEFRQDGGAMVTAQGDFLHVLVRYVYAPVDADKYYINSGFYSIKMSRSPGGLRILSVVESLTRDALSYAWPANR